MSAIKNKGGPPLGSKNHKPRPRIWTDALRKALAIRDEKGKKRIYKLARALLDNAEEGDISALKEFGDRIEGKVPQALIGEDGPIIRSVERIIITHKS